MVKIKDYEVPIADALRTILTPDWENLRVYAGENVNDVTYPCITVTQSANSTLRSTKDSGGYHHAVYAFDINVCTNGQTMRDDCFSLAESVCEYMQSQGFQMDSMNRNMGDSVAKYERTVMRFTAVIDTNTNTIYGG